jgi:hypothetical protein
VTVILTESITFPRNVIICVRINIDFFSCIKNPKFCNKQTVSSVDYGNLHYRILEKEKNYALKKSFGNYDAYINVTNNMKSELKWWSDNIHSHHISKKCYHLC